MGRGVWGPSPTCKKAGIQGGCGGRSPPPKKGVLGGEAPQFELTNFCDNFSYVFVV